MSPLVRTAVGLFLGVALFGQTPSSQTRIQFAPGGAVTLKLEAGEYDLQPGAEDAIVVTWTADDPEAPEIRIQAKGTEATVVIADTPRHHFRARVQLPARTDLRVRLTAGDLRVGAFEGNKDLRLRAGNLTVMVPQPEQYGQVHASLWAGDIHAPAFGGERDGLFRSFRYEGRGTFVLRAALWAGDLTLAKP